MGYASQPKSRQSLKQGSGRRVYRGKSHRRHDNGWHSLHVGITVADITLINELQKSIKGNKVISFLGGGTE